MSYQIGVEIEGTLLTPTEITTGRKKLICKCRCGNSFATDPYPIKIGRTKSCGCFGNRHYQLQKIASPDAFKVFFDASFCKLPNGCWEWSKHRSKQGYGTVDFRKAKWLTHRVSWTLHRGEIPEGMRVLHRCDNPPCVNPEHLFIGTQKDNMHDASTKGRLKRSWDRKGMKHPCAKLTNDKVFDIRSSYSGGETQKSIAARLGISRASVCLITQRKSWKHV